MKYLLLLFFIVCRITFSYSQVLSDQTKISLITCDEGEEIYSLFGHSAIRVRDVRNNIDFVYNWGMFDFGADELDFQIRFAKGKLKYYMAEELYENFIEGYQWEQRTVREQTLNLTYLQKLALWKEIQINYRPENRYYQYDFFFDNCSTRINALLKKVLSKELVVSELPKANKYSYRQLIDKQVNKSQPWSDFGIDLALGKKIDQLATSDDMQFLPKYLEEFVALAKIKKEGKQESFVLENTILVKGLSHVESSYKGVNPMLLTWALFIILLILHFVNIQKLAILFDITFLILFGVLGILVLLLWFYTDHQPTKLNYNLLWANPIHIITIIMLFIKKEVIKKYYLVMAFYSFSIVLFWIALPQEFNPAVRPLILIQVLIYYSWYKRAELKYKK
jgi:hypothetical protein